MEAKCCGEPKRWSPVDSELVLVPRFGMDWWPKERSGLNGKKQIGLNILGSL